MLKVKSSQVKSSQVKSSQVKSSQVKSSQVKSSLGYSPDLLQAQQQNLLNFFKQAYPELISDNQLNLEKLKSFLSPAQIAPKEHYELSWAGKTEARREIQKTTSHTLLPTKSNPKQAQHMLIEGENLEVLRILQKSYHGKVKMIYIDPPYNTGGDSFIYPDDYSESLEEYQKRSGEKDESGFLNKQSLWKKNSKENGQYHSVWLSMMYPRLYLARNLLRDDGVIFISIDDNEQANLKLLCDEVFGAENFLACLPTIMNLKGNNDEFAFSGTHELTLVYAKNKNTLIINQFPIDEEELDDWFEDEKGLYKQGANLKSTGVNAPREKRPNLFFPIFIDDENKIYITEDNSKPNNYFGDLITIYPITDSKEMSWRWSKEKFKKENDDIIISRNNGSISLYKKQRSTLGELPSKKPKTIFYKPEYSSGNGTSQIKDFFENKIFNNPKPLKLIKDFLILGLNKNDLILDFFAGSGTTMQAVMELNLEDGGSRQCICVQLPELTYTIDKDGNEKPREGSAGEAYKAGYRTIAEITKARIEKVIAKLKIEQPEKTADLAYAHFTLAPSNFKTWRSNISDSESLQAQLEMFLQSEKQTVLSPEQQQTMLAELLLKYGLGVLGVHSFAKSIQVDEVTIHCVLRPDNRSVWFCFEQYNQAIKTAIVKQQPAQVLMLNSCFVGNNADEAISNLQLELAELNIELRII